VKEDSGSVIAEAAEAPGVSLDGLDTGVEAIAGSIFNRMHEVGQEVCQMLVRVLAITFTLARWLRITDSFH
jgi:hypothetical protein